jgi:hypothetical protein
MACLPVIKSSTYYDRVGRTSFLFHQDAATGLLSGYSFGYDHRNRLTAATEYSAAGTLLSTVLYTYDNHDIRISRVATQRSWMPLHDVVDWMVRRPRCRQKSQS